MAARSAAADRERTEMHEAGADPRRGLAQALVLIGIGGSLHGWPAPDDPVSEREDAEARANWVRLREALLGR